MPRRGRAPRRARARALSRHGGGRDARASPRRRRRAGRSRASTVIHRFGLIPAGRATSSSSSPPRAHRGAAFEAAEFLMDYLKTRAPVLEAGAPARRHDRPLGRGASGEDDSAPPRAGVTERPPSLDRLTAPARGTAVRSNRGGAAMRSSPSSSRSCCPPWPAPAPQEHAGSPARVQAPGPQPARLLLPRPGPHLRRRREHLPAHRRRAPASPSARWSSNITSLGHLPRGRARES